MITINPNDCIEIRLTPQGITQYFKYHKSKEMSEEQISSDLERISLSDGRYKFQIATFYRIFGHRLMDGQKMFVNQA